MNQAELEQDMVRRGVDRYYADKTKAEQRGQGHTSLAFSLVVNSLFTDVLSELQKVQNSLEDKYKKTVSSGARFAAWEPMYLMGDLKAFSYIGIRTILSKGPSGPVPAMVVIAGNTACLDIRWAQARAYERSRVRGTGQYNRVEHLKRLVRELNPQNIAKHLRTLDDIPTTKLSGSARAQMGAVIIDCVIKAAPHYFKRVLLTNTVNKKHHRSVKLQWSDELLEQLRLNHEWSSVLEPWLLPMIEPPIPFEGPRSKGGYHTEDMAVPIVKRHKIHYHQLIPSQDSIAALNRIQSTPWCINDFILDLAEYCVRNDVGPLPYEHSLPMPESIPKETWAIMDKEQRSKVKAAREHVHSHNARHDSKRGSALRSLTTAREFSVYPQVWFPWNFDWRGRLYPISQDLHPQADELSRSLLQFAAAKPLGLSGLQHLACHVASCYGLDKATRTEQELWTRANQENLEQLVKDPLSKQQFWGKADKPWLFMAASHDWVMADNNPNHKSRIPVHLDGTCNGLQHLSAMSRDEIGGEAVNLLPGPRQDIYQRVADRVSELAKGTVWDAHVTRKTVKRAVMTIPYGLTKIGMREQLIADRHCDPVPGDPFETSKMISDMISLSLDTTLSRSIKTMSWLKDLAKATVKDSGVPVKWTTPCGNTVIQHYVLPSPVRVQTVLGKFILNSTKHKLRPMAVKKATNSIAPNVIHSYDASHLILTVLDMQDVSWSLVHDSYGVHACDVDRLDQSLKKTWVSIYRHNQFEHLMFSIVFDNPNIDPDSLEGIVVPDMGNLDVDAVKNSEYFFY